jgi:GNAT superfamily N-acetyltransferase
VSDRALTLRIVDAAGLAPFARDLVALEASIEYPIADGADRFTIDHGEAYHPFFSALGDARFLLALDGDRVVGAMVGVFREANDCGRPRSAAYLCDFKVAASHRGTGVARRMATYALAKAATDPSLWRWRIAYAAAMRGERGDVTRSMKGAHAGKLLRPAATLAVYFASARALASLDATTCPKTPAGEGLDLSPAVRATCEGPGVTSTAGRKDLRLVSTGRPWPLAHLPIGPRAWGDSLAAYLRACGEWICARSGDDATVCFALDEALTEHVRWLAARGVSPGAACTVYTLRLAAPSRERPPWVHLATSEI